MYAAPGRTSPIQRLLPILQWLPAYRREWFASDVLAGLAVWAIMVPAGMAYSGILGVPPIHGLYTLVPPLIAYAILGSSRLLVVGPDTATGLISALAVGAVVAQGSPDFVALTSTLAILVGVFFLGLGALRMGWVAAFIPTSVMRGFIEGLVTVTIVGQLSHLLGVQGGSGNFFAKLAALVRQIPNVAFAPAAIGLLSLAAMQLLGRFAPRAPAALVVAAAATALVGLIGGESLGVSVVGELPSGLPRFALPRLDMATLAALAPGALAIVLVGYAEALGGAKAVAAEAGGEVDPSQELVAHGPANILSGLFGGYLVVGSLSKTSVAMASGGRTQIANLVAAALCLLTLAYLTPLFRTLPDPALGAIVIAAMLHLSKPDYLRQLFARNKWEFALAVTVFAGELTLGVLQGIALGVVLALVLLIYRVTHAHGTIVGQLPGTEAYDSVELHPEAVTFPGLMIWRAGGDLFFASVDRAASEFHEAVVASRAPVKHVLVDAGPVSFIDTTACDSLLKVVAELRAQSVTFAFARVSDRVRKTLRVCGVEAAVGAQNFFARVTDGVRAWQVSNQNSQADSGQLTNG